MHKVVQRRRRVLLRLVIAMCGLRRETYEPPSLVFTSPPTAEGVAGLHIWCSIFARENSEATLTMIRSSPGTNQGVGCWLTVPRLENPATNNNFKSYNVAINGGF
jgi:hypothetical protein